MVFSFTGLLDSESPRNVGRVSFIASGVDLFSGLAHRSGDEKLVPARTVPGEANSAICSRCLLSSVGPMPSVHRSSGVRYLARVGAGPRLLAQRPQAPA